MEIFSSRKSLSLLIIAQSFIEEYTAAYEYCESENNITILAHIFKAGGRFTTYLL